MTSRCQCLMAHCRLVTKMGAIGLVVCGWLLWGALTNATAQQRPLLTEDVDIVETGRIRLQAGADFFQNQRFGLSGLRGDLYRPVVLGLHFGLNTNVGFSIEGSLRDYLSIRERGTSAIPLAIAPGAASTSGASDFTLWTKIKLRKETRRAPSFGVRVGVQLPNSDQSRGIGLNATNVFGVALVGKRFANERVNVFGNIGIGILTSPIEPGAQQDVLTYGLAAIYRVTDRVDVLGEVAGRYNPRTPVPGLESQGQARLGARLRAAGFQWDLAGVAGLTKFSPRRGLTFGVTYEFKGFEPVK
ncbi:hypothetical protein J8C06_08280 [Chloracidobacterium validum]|uniref:Outer membrane beta-barrel porin/alpha-amylase n=1 Tax=Chloracidobacterium validum TaxID=2821543 RepID=A0ABX8B5V6_9BACT|nr:hypothetical protein [Chloracidobacterium validum]QUW02352.1 hypothetical protein J8C06_08280 [Chloracidobacterium validum]